MEITSQITASVEYSKTLDVDAEVDFARHHRPRRAPRRLEENSETMAVLDRLQFFRMEFK